METFAHRQVTIKREKITWPGARIKKKGEGLPQHEQNNVFGDLYVTIDVDFPKGEVSNEQREGFFRLHLDFDCQPIGFVLSLSVIKNLFNQQSKHRLYNGI